MGAKAALSLSIEDWDARVEFAPSIPLSTRPPPPSQVKGSSGRSWLIASAWTKGAVHNGTELRPPMFGWRCHTKWTEDQMGFLDQVIGGMLGSGSRGEAANNGGIADALKELLGNGRASGGDGTNNDAGSHQPQGGLGGLLDRLTQAGHGDVADSWVSPGENRQLAPHQLEQALDPNTIDELARRSGLSRDELLRQLSQHLPTAVDRLTPQGRRPTAENMGHW